MTRKILMFHDVYRETPSESGFLGAGPDLYKLSEENFTEIIRYICECKRKEDYVFTFDDGGISFYTVIAPILESYNLRGIFFIATESIGQPGFMTSDQILDLDSRGHLIGSHSHTHRRLSSIPKTEVYNEWEKSKNILESIVGHEVAIASIPNGYQSDFVLSEAAKCGFIDMYTSTPTCRLTRKMSLDLYGRFVIMKDVSTAEINRLDSKFIRSYLYMRAKLLLLIQKVMGPYYKKIRNYLVK